MNSVVLHLIIYIYNLYFVFMFDLIYLFLKITWLRVVFSNLFILSLSLMQVNKIANNNTNSLDKEHFNKGAPERGLNKILIRLLKGIK